jgi:ribosomal protein S18 acetylase RimI-like enzyme
VLDAYVGAGFRPDGNPYADELLDVAARHREAAVLVATTATHPLAGTVTFALPGSPWAEVAAPDEAELRMLAVAPDVRGQGVGQALVAACVDRARAAGMAGVAISTTTWMADAHRLYARLGFVRTPERDWSPRPGIDLWVLRLALGEPRPGRGDA